MRRQFKGGLLTQSPSGGSGIKEKVKKKIGGNGLPKAYRPTQLGAAPTTWEKERQKMNKNQAGGEKKGKQSAAAKKDKLPMRERGD